MSRFFQYSDSESEYSTTESESSIHSEQEFKSRLSRYMEDSDSDDSSMKRVVKSQQEKQNEQVQASISKIENSVKIADWVNVNSEYDSLLRLVQKFQLEGHFYLMVGNLLDDLEGVDKTKLNPSNYKAFNTLRQKARKVYKSNQEEIDSLLALGYVPQVQEAVTDLPELMKVEDKNEESITRRLEEIMSVRGRKNTDKDAQVLQLQTLLNDSQTAAHRTKVLLALVSSQFDAHNVASMTLSCFHSVMEEIHDLLDIVENGVDLDVSGSILSFVLRIDNEFVKALQFADPHSSDYLDMLRQEKTLYALIARAQAYFIKSDQINFLNQILERRLEHLYGKPTQVLQVYQKAASKYDEVSVDSEELIQRIFAFLQRCEKNLKAIFLYAYHLASQGRHREATDLLLDSNAQNEINSLDQSLKILYNRALVQTGIASFKKGLVNETHRTLLEICTSGKHKELLGQSFKETRDRTLLVPFHQHINIELVDGIFLICSILIQVPLLASQKKKSSSKFLRKLLCDSPKFEGPSGDTRDLLIKAAKFLQEGNWKECCDIVLNLSIWTFVDNSIKSILQSKIQTEAMRVWLLTNYQSYSKLSLKRLEARFQFNPLPVVSEMIYKEELNALVDDDFLVVQKEEDPCSVYLALSEKLASLSQEIAAK